jgi:cytochrome c biogenesis protein CcmG/thiol:disulfide interchange protein DsbE
MAEEGMIEPTPTSSSRNWGVVFVWVIVIGILALVGFGLINANRGPLEVGKPAPDFIFTTFDGDQIDTQDLRGQVVVVNIWATWCLGCRDEAAELEQAYRMFKDRGVVFLGADWSDTETKALEYLEEFDITYPNGPDYGGRIHKAFRVKGLPETYIIGPDGQLTGFKIGAFSSLAEIVSAVELALGQ